ncbi:uncharacterized protein METZ01_LOCUS173553, partial [marine metagenome]
IGGIVIRTTNPSKHDCFHRLDYT